MDSILERRHWLRDQQTNQGRRMTSVSDFEQGQSFSVEAAGQTIALELSAIKPIANSPRDGGGFTLLFGPDVPAGGQFKASERHGIG